MRDIGEHCPNGTCAEATDLAAARPWHALDAPTADRLHRLLTPPARACAAALRFPNPMGLPAPAHRR